tara:strand:+ start:210 stop:590 length:381 start_codon:yes stop_codon:yes gene_type:complete
MSINSKSIKLKSSFSSLSDIIIHLDKFFGSMRPCYQKDSNENHILVNNNKVLVGYLFTDLASDITLDSLDDDFITELSMHVKKHKKHLNSFYGLNKETNKVDNSIVLIGKFNNKSLEEVCSDVENM